MVSQGTQAPVPKRYKGHVSSIVPAIGDLPRLVMVVVDEGPEAGKVFRVDRDNTPDWLNNRMAVEFLLVPLTSSRGSKERPRIATDITPQTE